MQDRHEIPYCRDHAGGTDYRNTEDQIIELNKNQKQRGMTLEALAQQGRRYVSSSLAASVGQRLTEHRMETVANIHGIEFINDSRSCSINSAWFAMESMRKPVIWIAGGLDRVL